jgi:uncharacterized iron-regulated membrane protein
MSQANEPGVDPGKLLIARRRSLLWRIHFWAALIASPFALVAALTGIVYVFTPQVERALYGAMERVVPVGSMRPLDDAVAAAKAAAPRGWPLRSVVPSHDGRDSVKVYFDPTSATGREGHHHTPANAISAHAAPAQPIVVHVDPYTAQVLGTQVEAERFGNWSRRLHSSLLQGQGWRWMIELGASWLMVMLLTGIYLWWSRGGSQKILPEKNAKGRNAWAQWHSFVGIVLSIMSLAILTTGLTWSKYAGNQVRMLRDAAGQASPPMPRNLKSTMNEGGSPLTWQAAWDIARREVPEVRMLLKPPREPDGIWHAACSDSGQPEKKFDLFLDAYSGQKLFYAGWDRQTAFAKATAIGIPFHRGEFGLWNQALLLVFGIGVLFSITSGWVMFFKRRQPGSLGLPHLMPGAWQSPSIAAWLTAGVLFFLMPLLAISSAAVLAIELLLHRLPCRAATRTCLATQPLMKQGACK